MAAQFVERRGGKVLNRGLLVLTVNVGGLSIEESARVMRVVLAALEADAQSADADAATPPKGFAQGRRCMHPDLDVNPASFGVCLKRFDGTCVCRDGPATGGVVGRTPLADGRIVLATRIGDREPGLSLVLTATSDVSGPRVEIPSTCMRSMPR